MPLLQFGTIGFISYAGLQIFVIFGTVFSMSMHGVLPIWIPTTPSSQALQSQWILVKTLLSCGWLSCQCSHVLPAWSLLSGVSHGSRIQHGRFVDSTDCLYCWHGLRDFCIHSLFCFISLQNQNTRVPGFRAALPNIGERWIRSLCFCRLCFLSTLVLPFNSGATWPTDNWMQELTFLTILLLLGHHHVFSV